jgi:hypothetical protein
MDFFDFTTPCFSIEETIEIFNENEAWNFKYSEEDSLFKGILISVKDLDLKLSKSEILGYVDCDEFKSKVETDSFSFEEQEIKLNKEEAIAIQCSNGVLVITKQNFPLVKLPLNINKVAIEKNKNKKIEGYWHSKYSPQYPMPIANQLNEREAAEIYKLIKIKEAEAEKLISRGIAYSRIDDTGVGNCEYHHIDWLWPESLAPHYVFQYKVKPTDDFLKFIGWNQT